ncbi:hypothetical protein HG530_005703 [Fusarium avenaceum]|nr:hypothetical protein HG530_005703 [Fusarium avenaceum]
MSFGFSVGDIIAVVTLASKIRKDFKGAPKQFNSISEDIRSLSVVIQDAHANFDQLAEHQITNFGQILTTCHNLLKELENIMSKWSVISKPRKGKAVQRLWKRLRWEPEEIVHLRAQITSNVVLLNAYNDHATNYNVAKLVRQNESDKQQAVLDWISSIDYVPQHNHLVSRLQANSRRWLFDAAEYQDWQNQKGRTLFCPGDPGTGKTFTTAIVFETLQEKMQNSPDVLNTYVYCTYQAPDQDVQGLLRSLLRNSLQQVGTIPAIVLAQCDRKRAAKQDLFRDETIKLLETLYCSFGRVTVLVDALDELPTEVNRPFISALLKLQKCCQLNLFITSRLIPEIQHQFAENGAAIVEIRASDEDIHQFLEDSLFHLPRFLLAELHLRSLKHKRSPKALRSSLAKLSVGSDAYDDVYENAMMRIASSGTESEALAREALLILVCARETLHTEDLAYALSVESDSETIDPDNIPDIEDVAGVCAGLITIDKQSNNVKLVHKSAQEYFERNQARWFPKASEVMARLCLKYMALTSLTAGFDKGIEASWPPFWRYADINWAYHSRCAERDDDASKATNNNIEESRPLSTLHSLSTLAISLLATDMAGSLHSALVKACREGRHALVELLISVNNYDLNLPSGRSFSTCQSKSAVSTPGEYLTSEDDDTCSESSCEYKAESGEEIPLWVHESFSDTGLEKHYDHGPVVISRNRWGKTDSDTNEICQFGWLARNDRRRSKQLEDDMKREASLLIIAAANGDHDMVRVLLNNGADPNVVGTLNQTALYIAARKGHKCVVSLLLDQPTTNTNCEYKGYVRHGLAEQRRVCWTPLLAAAYRGHADCVKLLLDHAERNYRDEDGRNATYLAAEAGHTQVLKELLRWSDVELNSAVHSPGLSPLEIALENGHEDAAIALIPYSDINSSGSNGDRPLNLAAKAMSLKAIRQLFARREICVNAAGYHGHTVIHNAAMAGHKKMIELILTHPEIDINIRDNNGNTPFMKLMQFSRAKRAKFGNYLGSMALFLSRPELDINAQNKNGNTALLIVASFKYWEHRKATDVFNTLFDYPGINREHKNNLGQSILVRAIVEGSRIIQRIVKETELTRQFGNVDDDGETLLSLAASSFWPDALWRYMVEMSPPEFMQRKNREGQTPGEIRKEASQNGSWGQWNNHSKLWETR